MPRVSFLFGAPRRASIAPSNRTLVGPVQTIEVVELDASISESHEITGELTDHPIESGTVISDHYRLMPQKLTIHGIITDSPMRDGLIAGAISSVDGIMATESEFQGSSRVDVAYESLRQKMRNADLLAITTSLKSYENMVLIGTTVSREAQTGNVLDVSLHFREIFRVYVNGQAASFNGQTEEQSRKSKENPLKEPPDNRSNLQKFLDLIRKLQVTT